MTEETKEGPKECAGTNAEELWVPTAEVEPGPEMQDRLKSNGGERWGEDGTR